MIRKAIRVASGVAILTGATVLLGAVGASDLNMISFNVLVSRLLIGITSIAVGAYGLERL